jgi:hypothetical protein
MLPEPKSKVAGMEPAGASGIADILFLRHLHHPDLEPVKAVIASFSPHHRQQAEENLIYLELATP